MSLNEIDLLNSLLDARDAALVGQRRRLKEQSGG